MKYPGPGAAIDDQVVGLDALMGAQTKARVQGNEVLGEFSDLLSQAYDAKPGSQAAILAEAYKRYVALEVAQKAGLQLLMHAHRDLELALPWGDQSRGTESGAGEPRLLAPNQKSTGRRKGAAVAG